jgi:DNA (cytosine-5)-methyltransferase 1
MNAIQDIRLWREDLGLSQTKLAEITGIPQHLISAHELGKDTLDTVGVERIHAVAADANLLSSLVNRKKRYTNHEYCTINHDLERVRKQKATIGNIAYKQELLGLIPSVEKNAPTAISLFSGCGGMSLGFSSSGFDIRGHLELDDGLNAIYTRNFPKSERLGSDIRNVNNDALTEFASTLGGIDLIVGGPPCQGFSLAGKRKKDDPRNALFYDYLRFVDAFRPKVAVMENVRLLTSMRDNDGNFVKNNIVEEFERRDYRVEMFEVNAKDYGVPQHRERVFFLAVDKNIGVLPSFPPKSSEWSLIKHSEFQPFRTFADACSDLAFLESGEIDETDHLHKAVSHPKHVIEWLWDVPEGHSAHDNEDANLRPPSGYNTTYKRQIWFEPASTVQTTFGMISGCRNVHPIATRSLSIREAARIQSFPDWYRFEGSQGTIRTGIGNAVPPLLAFRIAQHLLATVPNLVKVSSF